jgi:phosphatidylinositol alpha-mannosyltransferase
MRVALVCPYAWDAPGGVQVHVGQLALHLRSRGHVVLVLAPGRAPAPEPWVRIVGRPVRVPYGGSVAPICPSPAAGWRVRAALRAFGPDVVHVHEPLAPSLSMFAMLSSDAPVVATFHSGAERSRLFDLLAPLLRRVVRRVRVRIAVSERAAEFARSRLGGSFRIVPNGTDVARFLEARPAGLPPGRKILFVGRLEVRKGFPVALAAFERLAGELPDVRLVVVGEGEQRGAIASLDGAARRRVDMLGQVPNEELPTYHAAADVFLAPSLGGESFGIVLVEAMAAGLPVVSSRIPGYDRVVTDGVQGFLVPPGDANALAEATRRLLEDPELARRMGEAGLERSRRFDWSTVGREIEAAYREAAGRP